MSSLFDDDAFWKLPQAERFTLALSKLCGALCQKCKKAPATINFNDEEGNRYDWCRQCHDE